LTVKKGTPELGAFDDVARTFGEAGFTLAKPSSDSRAAITLSSSNPAVAAVDGASGAVSIVGAGTTTFTASQVANDDFVAASKTMTFTVRQATPTLGAMTGATKTFGDTDFTLTKPSSPSGGAFSFSSSNAGVVSVDADGKVSVVGAGTATITATQAATGNYTSSSSAAVVTVGRATTAIANLSLSNLTYGASDVTLAPRSSNPSPFTYTSSSPNVLAVNATTGRVSVVGIGTATITVRQASSANYEAGSESLTVQIGRATPTLSSFSAISKDYGDAPFTLTPPVSSSPGVYSYTSSNTAVATVDAASGAVSVVGIGVTSLMATQAQTDYFASSTAITTLTVSRGTPMFGDFIIASKAWGASNFTLAAPTSTSTGAFTFSIVDVAGVNESAIATVTSAGAVSITGVGAVTIRATQDATSVHVSSSITSTLTIAQGVPVLGALLLPTTSHRTPIFSINPPTSTSSGPFLHSSSNEAVVQVNSATGEVVVLSQGSSVVTATQTAFGNFMGGSVSQTITVSAPPCASGSPVDSSTVEVTNTNDSGVGSLRTAVTTANASSSINRIEFTCGLTGKITLASALPVVSDGLTLVGNGRLATVIDGNALYRPFYVNSGKSLTISSVTLQRGQNTGGGLIYNSQGTVNATDVRFTSMSGGSAVFNNNGTTISTYTDSTFDYLASGINGDYGSTPVIPAGYTSWNLVPETVFTNRTFVTNCIFDRNTYGINNFRYTRIRNSTFTNNSNTAARVTGINRTWISDSRFTGNGTAIYVSGTPQSTHDMGVDQRLIENNTFSANSTGVYLADYQWVTAGNSYRGYQRWSKVLTNQWDGQGVWLRYFLWNGTSTSTLSLAGTNAATADFVHEGNSTTGQ